MIDRMGLFLPIGITGPAAPHGQLPTSVVLLRFPVRPSMVDSGATVMSFAKWLTDMRSCPSDNQVSWVHLFMDGKS